MIKFSFKCLFLFLPSLICFSTIAQEYSNNKYDLKVSPQGAMSISSHRGAKQVVFNPNFMLNYLDEAPDCSMQRIDKNGFEDNLNFRTVNWEKEKDLFKVGNQLSIKPTQVIFSKDFVRFHYPATQYGQLSVDLRLPEGDEEPVLKFNYKVNKSGYHSVGYVGAPEVSLHECEEVWQPLVWTQKRFPGKSYLTPDYLCSMPLTAVKSQGVTYAVVVDPAYYPFMPLPTFRHFQFGVAVRNSVGNAQPMVWAPVVGTPESKFEKGDVYSFALRLVVNDTSMLAMHEDVALNLYGLKNYHRDNQIGVNLNTTFDNMVDFGMSHYSWFIDYLKGCAYESDVKTAIKNVSSLNPLNIALVTDNQKIYTNRFLPICEFMLSRENLLFALVPHNRGIDRQVPGNVMGKSIAVYSDAVTLYDATGCQTNFLLNKDFFPERPIRCNKVTPSNIRFIREDISLYHATKDTSYLRRVGGRMDNYMKDCIETISDKFDYPNELGASSFWPHLCPRFQQLYIMWQETGNRKYLEAAQYAAHRYAQYIYMCPAIPNEKVVVNKGGVAPKQKRYGVPMKISEETVDAWRLSEIGLHAECGSTANSHRAVFIANFASYMLKIAHDTGDEFLAKIANWAMVGRYANFPGYHINTARTTVYEKKQFPLHTFTELNVNSIHYNHIWPMMSIVLDYLVSDIEVKTDFAVNFPSLTVASYGNFDAELYGHKLGQFYGNEVQLWMPQRLLSLSNPQLNYLTARRGDKLFIVFSNQSLDKQCAHVKINHELVTLSQMSCLNTLSHHAKVQLPKLKNYEFDVEVEGNATFALCIDQADMKVKFQDKLMGHREKWQKDIVSDEFGRAMLLNFGANPARVFNFISGTPGMYKRVGITYRINGGDWVDDLDCLYPFEFSIDLPESAHSFEYKYVVIDKDDHVTRTPVYKLEK